MDWHSLPLSWGQLLGVVLFVFVWLEQRRARRTESPWAPGTWAPGSSTAPSANSEAPPPPPKAKRLHVRATGRGVYGSVKRKPGDIFEIAKDSHFFPAWMERLEEVSSTRHPIQQSDKQLTITLALKRNDGGTPGMHLVAQNAEADTVANATFYVSDIRRWDDSLQKFVMTEDIYGAGTSFTEIPIGKATLHPVTPTKVAFLRAEGGRVVIAKDGPDTEPNVNWYGVRTAGTWRIECRVLSASGATAARELCFRWDGKDTSCTPCDCPYPVSRAAKPLRPVR